MQLLGDLVNPSFLVLNQAGNMHSTVPATYTGSSRASEIMVAPDGRTLYASNRGYDSMAVLRINSDTGRLAATGFPLACGSPVCLVSSPSAKTC